MTDVFADQSIAPIANLLSKPGEHVEGTLSFKDGKVIVEFPNIVTKGNPCESISSPGYESLKVVGEHAYLAIKAIIDAGFYTSGPHTITVARDEFTAFEVKIIL